MRSLKGACWVGLALIACNSSPPQPSATDEAPPEWLETQFTTPPAALGDAIRGLTTAQQQAFEAGKVAFSSTEDPVADGLGPVFNERGCAVCHSIGAVGGTGAQIETRFGSFLGGVFDPLEAAGGSLIQVFGVGALTPGCDIKGEVVPPNANVRAGRRTTALFGLGLVDAVPEGVFWSLARAQPAHVRGRVNVVREFFRDPPRDAVGRFGWKAQESSLLQFSADAYLNEMGITTTSRVGSRLVTEFSHEILPPGVSEACDPKPGVDDADEEGIQEDLRLFTDFMRTLGPPPTGAITREVVSGAWTFAQTGCATCHTPLLRTGSSPVAALSNRSFSPYSDFLLHDMGSLGDGIGGQGRAGTREMRTAPLWGLRFADQTTLLHDGRAKSLTDAILMHDGQGRYARDAFKRLSSREVANLIAFLNAI